MGFTDWLLGGTAGNDIKDPANGGFVSSYAKDALTGKYGSRAAPVAGAAQNNTGVQLATGPQDQWRQQQMGLAQRLGAVGAGTQAGAGEMAVNRQVNAGTAAQQSAARMARGAGAALAARSAARNMADLGVNGAGMASNAAMQDQMNANGQLGQILGQGRGQDIDISGQNAQLAQQRAMQNAGFDQQTRLANLDAQLRQTGMNDAQVNAMLSQLLGVDQQTLAAQQARANANANDKGALGGILQAGGSALAAYAGGGMPAGGGAARVPVYNGPPLPQNLFGGSMNGGGYGQTPAPPTNNQWPNFMPPY